MAYDYDASAATFKVWKSGKELPSQAQTAIRSVTVEAGINMPRMCEIEFLESPAYIGEQSGNLSTGAEIAIFAYAAGNVTGDVLFKGKIRTQEISFDEGMGVRTVFRAYDAAHDMLSATRTKMYKETTIAEVVTSIAKKYSLTPLIGSAIASTSVKYDAIVQMNESDWDFICRLAREVGYIAYVRVFTQLTVSQTKLYFGPATKASKAPGSATRARGFKIGDGRIISLRAMVTGAGAPKEAVIPGWNEKSKAAAIGDQDLSSKMYETVDTKTSASSLRSSKAGKRMTLERVAGTVAEAEQMAKGYARRLAAATTDVELVVRGHPDAKLNEAIYLDQAGRLEGKYVISAVTAVFEPDECGCTTTIYCTGREDRTLAGLQGEIAHRPALNGVFPAIVSDINDPEKKGRVTVTLPWLDPKYVTGWARVVQMGAGAGRGWQMLPAPNDEVLVSFENGQLERPYVIGGVYGANKPKASHAEMVKNGSPVLQVLTSKTGHQIILDDSTDSSGIEIKTVGGASCEVKLDAKAGITISTKGEGKVTINAESDVNVTSKKNAHVTADTVTVKSKEISLDGTSKVEVSAPNVDISATSALNLKGMTVNVKATSTLKLDGGIVQLK